MAEPRVTVVTIVRDGEAYIDSAIRSVREQTFADLEHVIIDDGSQDATPDIVRARAAEDPRIRMVWQEPSGIPIARNRGIAETRGEYMAVLDADDVAMPTRLEKQVAFLDAHPDVGMVGGGEIALEPASGRLWEVRHPLTHEAIRSAWLYRQVFTHSATMMRMSVLRAVGGYDTAFARGSDPQLWARIAGCTRVANLPEPLVVRRYHPDQLTQRRDMSSVRHSLRIRRQAARQLRLPPWYYPLLGAPLMSGLPAGLKKWLRRRGRHEALLPWSRVEPVQHLLGDALAPNGGPQGQ
jgi:glycosyltransferase involved in cell wall biosynthesis